jgi:hypothetical protein
MTNSYFSKLKQISVAFTITLVSLFVVSEHTNKQNIQAQSISSCMVIESNLPMNHINHPCQTAEMSSNSWLSWLSGESKSTHLHFLDLVELIHYSRY